MKEVFLQYWEESERGWGVRPDGCSIHLDQNSLNKYIDNIYSGRDGDNVPHEYERVVGEPIKVEINDELYNLLLEKKNIRLLQHSLNNMIKLGDIIL